MDIKIICNCGTKLQFEVEPERGGMPVRINCPGCGVDVTSLANAYIHQVLQGGAPPSPVTQPPTPIAPPPPPPPPAPAGLRINKPYASSSSVPAPPPTSAEEAAPAPVRGRSMSHIVVEDEERKSGGQWKGIVAALLVLALIGLGAWKFGAKWYRRIKAVADIAAAAGQASVTASDDAPPEPHNLWEEDCVVLFVKHTNHTEVAEAFVKHWQEKYKKRLTINKVEAEEWRAGEYQVFPAHNGYVRIIGSLEWTQAQYEELAQHLSQQFNGYVFETRDVDFSGAFHFGVYEQGARKFHAQMDFVMKNGEPDEVVSTEGDDWALAHGFKPGEQGVKGFNMVDADRITQKLGMKMYDEQSGDQEVPILLRDFAANPGKIPARVPARLVGPSSMED